MKVLMFLIASAICLNSSQNAFTQNANCWKQLNDDIDSFFLTSYNNEFNAQKDSIIISVVIELDSSGNVINCTFPRYKGKFINENVLDSFKNFLLTKNYKCINDIYSYRTEAKKYHYQYNPKKAAKLYK